MKSIRRCLVQGVFRRYRCSGIVHWLGCLLLLVVTCSLVTRSTTNSSRKNMTLTDQDQSISQDEIKKPSISTEDKKDIIKDLKKFGKLLETSPKRLQEDGVEKEKLSSDYESVKNQETKYGDSTPKEEIITVDNEMDGVIPSEGNEDITFGFVNESYHYIEKPKSFLNSFMESPEHFHSNFRKTPTGEKIGSLLKAGVYLRNVTHERNQHDEDREDNNVKENSNRIPGNENNTPKRKDINANMKEKGRKGETVLKEKKRIKQDSTGSFLGNLINNVGPAMLSAAVLNSMGQSDDNQNPLLSIAKNVVPNMINGVLSGNSKSKASSQNSPMQSLVSGLGQAAMAAVSHQSNTNSNQNSNAGLLSNILNEFNRPQKQSGNRGEPSNPGVMGTLQSLAGQMGPAIISAAVMNSVSDPNSSNSLSGIVGKLVPSLMSNMIPQKKKQHAESRSIGEKKTNHADQSGTNKRLLNMEPPPLNNGGIEDKSKSETVSNKSLLKADSPKRERSGKRSISDQVSSDLPSPMNQVAKWAVQSVVKALPSSIGLETDPYTGGYLANALNLVLGNPSDSSNRHMQLFEWLRRGVPDTAADGGAPPRLLKALQLPRREHHRASIVKFYNSITKEQGVCGAVSSMGGVYHWKEDVLEKKQAVCDDHDVTLRSEDCIVLSFGIRDEWSFEKRAQSMGCKVWAFDPSMQTGNHNHSENIEFYNIGIGPTNRTLHTHNQVWSLFTYSAVLGHLGLIGSTIHYLKLDLPVWEWSILEEILKNSPELFSRVHQLGITVHLHKAILDPQMYSQYNILLDQLFTYGFQLFSSEPNTHHSKTFQDPLIPGRNFSLEYKLAYLRV